MNNLVPRLAATTLAAWALSPPAHAEETSFHAAGYGYSNLDIPVDGASPEVTGIAFNPIFLWREGDRILIENELEISEDEDGLDFGIEYSSVDFDLGGAVLVVGKFLSPAGQFISRIHPAWINKLPDFPLPYRLGVLPMANVGVAVQSAVHLSDRQKLTGVLYASTSPTETDSGAPNLMPTIGGFYGLPATGARVGLFILPELEVGASGFTAGYSDDANDRYSLGIVDFAWTSLPGVDVRGEGMMASWNGGAVSAAWVQGAWRLVNVERVRWLEPIVRGGWAQGDTFADLQPTNLPISAGHSSDGGLTLGDDPTYELCLGANAYIRNNVVLKTAYVHRVEINEPTVRVQLAFGY